jgi:hypothetical protein
VKQVAAAEQHSAALEALNATAALATINTVEVIRTKTQTLIKEVPSAPQFIQVPGPTMVCPAAVTGRDRLLLDAAATGTDPSTGPNADAAPYPAGPLTASVIANYATCRTDQAHLAGLQDYVARTLANQKLLCATGSK